MAPILNRLTVQVFFIFLVACHPAALYFEYRFDGQGRYIKDVPFFPQDENYCGPASLASVLGYWGQNLTQEDVARDVYTPQIKGTITVDMVNYIRRKGFEAVVYNGGMDRLKEEIDRGHPLILFLHMGVSMMPRRHYIVVVGYDESRESVIAYSGGGKNILIPYGELMKGWERTGNWTLLILPKDRNE